VLNSKDKLYYHRGNSRNGHFFAPLCIIVGKLVPHELLGFGWSCIVIMITLTCAFSAHNLVHLVGWFGRIQKVQCGFES